EQRGRQRAGHIDQDRGQSRSEHLREDRRDDARGGDGLRDAERDRRVGHSPHGSPPAAAYVLRRTRATEDTMGNAKKLIDSVWEIVESGALEKLPLVIDADCDFKMPGMAFKGIDPLRQLLAGYLAAFPDLRHHVRHAVESEDTIALELEVSGTHTGPMQTPHGAVAATGKKV